MTYFKILIENVRDDLYDDVSLLCFDYGASGLSEALKFTQPNLAYDPKILHQKNQSFEAFFEKAPPAEFLTLLREQFPEMTFTVSEEENKDWLEEWKKGFEPFSLVGDIWVVPSWREVPSEARKFLRIDPGMAFGTGTHETTQIAAHLVKKTFEANPQLKSVVDVGAGTGILSMLSEVLGADEVIAVEIDPEARRVAKQNFELNSMIACEMVDVELPEIQQKFDLVIANIIDGVLLTLKKDLLRTCKPGRILILTGILQERDDLFVEQFFDNPKLKILNRVCKNEWVGYSATLLD